LSTPPGEHGLARLLAGLEPALDPRPWRFVDWPAGAALPAGLAPFAQVREDEGETLVLPAADAERHGLEGVFECRRITLRVASALDAVGLTAAVSEALAAAGIPCNVVAGIHHDHLFVPAGDADTALAELEALAERGLPQASRAR
jgi:hypothetical protein